MRNHKVFFIFLILLIVTSTLFADYLSESELSESCSASRTILIDGFEVERLYFIDRRTLQNAPNMEQTLFREMSDLLKSWRIPNDYDLLGFFVFKTIDYDFFDVVPGNFAVILDNLKVKGTLKEKYQKYSSMVENGAQAFFAGEITLISHYMGFGIETFPVYSKAIDPKEDYQVILEWSLVTPKGGVKELENFIIYVQAESSNES
ncbi:hypothetical protein [Kosmotoga pacifica]|uniref:Uncharacterized protein n=1 Tax=Kosmotoga pacifica TaxID=1330330 RepID=A0A0G2ZCS9_9BACT|nr:hypothetical protein [Kosmotoga pacifica]AKI96558.1 hypothetical protein IX53_00555 [Kosmotoga pacifica]